MLLEKPGNRARRTAMDRSVGGSEDGGRTGPGVERRRSGERLNSHGERLKTEAVQDGTEDRCSIEMVVFIRLKQRRRLGWLRSGSRGFVKEIVGCGSRGKEGDQNENDSADQMPERRHGLEFGTQSHREQRRV